MMRVPSEKALRKIQVEIATRVAHHLSVKRKNAVLFKAVGNALGRPFVNTGNGGAAKAHGYASATEPTPEAFRQKKYRDHENCLR